jgi:hypothetical protein
MTERELRRCARHKLAVPKHVEEISGSVSATCRWQGISRNCYYALLPHGRGFAPLRRLQARPAAQPRRELARNFVLRELGEFAVDTPAAAAVRDTVAAYLACDRRLANGRPTARRPQHRRLPRQEGGEPDRPRPA